MWNAKALMGFCWIKILMQSLLFSVLAHHKSTVYSAFHHPVYPTSSDWTTTPPLPPSPPPPFLPLSLSHHPSSSLKFCIPTWSMCNELAGLRQTLYGRLFTERERERGADINVTLTGITHVTNTSGCIHTFSHPYTCTHIHACKHTQSHKDSQITLFLCEPSNHIS